MANFVVTDTLLDDLLPEAVDALRILIKLYRDYGRDPFLIRSQDIDRLGWNGRSEQERFHRAISLLEKKRYLRRLEDSHYEIATQEIIGAEERHHR